MHVKLDESDEDGMILTKVFSNSIQRENVDVFLLVAEHNSSEWAKEQLIERLLAYEPPHIDRLKQMCVLPRGLLTNNLRRKVWPAILGITAEELAERRPSRSQSFLSMI